jgi:transposase-like protein
MARMLDESKRMRIVRLLLGGCGIRQAARAVGCAINTVIAVRDSAKEIKPQRKRKP